MGFTVLLFVCFSNCLFVVFVCLPQLEHIYYAAPSEKNVECKKFSLNVSLQKTNKGRTNLFTLAMKLNLHYVCVTEPCF